MRNQNHSHHVWTHIIESFILVFFFAACSLIFIYPIIQGLILLPLDLLVSNYSPWHAAGTILLKNPFMQDSILQMFPWRHLTMESLKNGILPFWNPYQFMGMPFMPGAKPMIFYPLTLLFGIGEIQSWHTLILFQLFAGMVFMYLLVRDFKAGKIAAIISSLSFSLSSLMVGVIEFGSEGNVLVWFPILLFAVKRYFDRKKGIYLFLLGFSVTCAVFAGQLQYVGYELLTTVLFIIIYGRSFKSTLYAYSMLLVAILTGIGISAVQLIPSFEMFSNSYRGLADSYAVFSQGLLTPYHLVRLIAPDFFGHPSTRDLTIGYIEQSGYFGIIPLFFALYAMIRIRKNFLSKFLTGVFIFGVLFSMNGFAQILYILKIPLITSGYGGRLFSVVLFSGSVLSGLGLTAYLTDDKSRKTWFVGSFVLPVFIFLILSVSLRLTSIVNIKFPILILILFTFVIYLYHFTITKYKSPVIKIGFMIVLLGLTYLDLFRLGYRFLTFSNSKFFYPETEVVAFVKNASSATMDRVYGLTEPELPTYIGVYSPETYNPLYPMRTALLLQALTGKEHEVLPVNKYYMDKSPRLKYVLDFLGTSILVVGKGENPSIKYFLSSEYQGDLTKLYSDEWFEVYKNTTAYPRFGVYYAAKQNLNDREILDDMKNKNTDLKNILLLEDSLPVALFPGSGSAELKHSTVNEQVFEVITDREALLYVSDTYYPGWIAKINGIENTIYRTNYNFRSVLVPQGKSEVKFIYTPTHWSGLLLVSGLSFVCLIGLAVIHKK